jgi:ATP-dependent helicase/nuclease subunit A
MNDVQISQAQRRNRWETALRPTYDSQTVTALVRHASSSLSGGDPFGPIGREADWGTVIHLLLQTAMARPETDFQNLVLTALDEVGIESSWATEAVKTVEAVRSAAFWKRAQKASKRLIEVPFQTLQAPIQGGLPTIVRGVIDLAFREEPGWTVVDYKTGIVTANESDPCVERYRDQVGFYATTLSNILGEPVVEKALFMIPLNAYRAV